MDLVVLVALSSWLAPALGEHYSLFETDLCTFTCSPPLHFFFFCCFGCVLSSPMLKQAVCTTGSAFGREVFGKFSLHTSGHWQRMAIRRLASVAYLRGMAARHVLVECVQRAFVSLLALKVILFPVWFHFMYFPF